MRAFKFILICTSVLLGGVTMVQAGAGMKSGNSGTNRTALVTELKKEIVPGFPSMTRAIVSAGTNKFAFLVPRDFRIDASGERMIKIASPDEAVFITVRIRPRLPQPAGEVNDKSFREACRKALLEDQPGAKIISEFSRGADGRNGPAFDTQWKVGEGAVEAARTAFIPCPAGVLEFKLTTKVERFHRATYKLNNVLLSFRASQDGKLDYATLSNKF